MKNVVFAIATLLTISSVSIFAEDPKLKSMTFVSSVDQIFSSPVDSQEDFSSHGIALFDRNPKFLRSLQDQFIGASINQELFSKIEQEICAFYENKDQPFVLVTIPEQSYSNGVLQVVVEEATLGDVIVKGNQFFSASDLMSYIQTPKGSPIVMEDVLSDISWMNQNPFRRTDALFVPGAKPGTADLELLTIDRWPYRVYAGADNTGMISTQRNRFFMGFDFGKTIVRDSQISYQFSASPNWNHFYAHTVSARVPCPWKHTFIFYGGYSQVKPELIEPGEKEKGTSWQVDVRYRMPWVSSWPITQEFILGYDFKETQDWVRQDHKTIFSSVADTNQFMLGYELGYQTSKLTAKLQIEGYANPGGITSRNHTCDYESFRKGANATYGYIKAVQSFLVKFWRDWSFAYDLSGQLSTTNLLPSEQFVLAGYNAVRGFEERIVSVDNAALANITLETPHVCISNYFTKKKQHLDDLYFIAFFDAGVGANRISYGDEHVIKTLGSVGAGIRYQFSRYVTARLDYGFQLWHSGFYNPSGSRYNFGIVMSY